VLVVEDSVLVVEVDISVLYLYWCGPPVDISALVVNH